MKSELLKFTFIIQKVRSPREVIAVTPSKGVIRLRKKYTHSTSVRRLNR